jgi:phage shock protein E
MKRAARLTPGRKLQGKKMKKFRFLLAVVCMVFGMALSTFGAEGEEPLVIDVRTEAEWNNGHLEGAVLIPYDVIGEKIGTVAKDKSKPIYVYCRTGRRSQIAKEALERLGYKNVKNLGSLQDAAKTMKRRIVR